MFCSEAIPGCGTADPLGRVCCQVFPMRQREGGEAREKEREREQRAGHRTALCHQTLCQPWLQRQCTDGWEKTNCNCSIQVAVDAKNTREEIRKGKDLLPHLLSLHQPQLGPRIKSQTEFLCVYLFIFLNHPPSSKAPETSSPAPLPFLPA